MLRLPLLAVVCVSAQDFRAQLLKLARDRIELWDKGATDPSQFVDSQQSGDIVSRLSVDDKQCAPEGETEGVPLTYMEFPIDGVRPVDAFNVLTDLLKQPSWDVSCNAAASLGDFKQQRARGYAMGFAAKPLSTREMFEWLVVDANKTTEEFWVVFSTLNGELLHERRPNMDGAVEAQNCLAAYRFKKTTEGVRATMTQQINGHSYPLTARYIAKAGFPNMVTWVKAFRDQAKLQGGLGWNDTRLFVPDWMLHDQNCTAAKPDTDTRDQLVAKATEEFNREDRGREQLNVLPVPEGRMWQRTAQCGNSDVPTQNLPMWQLEFPVKGVSPEELFNVLAAKGREPSWNKQVSREELLQHRGGARGVHEMLPTPKDVPKLLASTRELWQWQAAKHSMANRTYLLVLSSQDHASSPHFESDSIEAAQCLAAYEVSPATGGGSLLRVIQQPNPNIYKLIGHLAFLWSTISQRMLGQWAEDLIAEAQRLATERRQQHGFPVDGDVLALLAPAPPERNASISLQVALNSSDGFLQAFAQLDIPAQLNITDDFVKCAATVHQLGLRLQRNATEQEFALLRMQAADSLDLQLQGEALAAVQWRILEEQAKQACIGGNIPDPNKHADENGLSVTQVICIGVAFIVTLFGLCVAVCCGCRKYRARKRRQLRLAGASDALTLPPEVSMSNAVSPA